MQAKADPMTSASPEHSSFKMIKKLSEIGTAMATAFLVVQPMAVLAEEEAADAASSITVEMNGTAQLEGACQLTFMLRNGFEADIMALVFETVLLTEDGAVDRLTLFDMGVLPSGSPRVRQFNVPQLACDDLGQVLINGVSECTSDGISAAACTAALTYKTRIDVEILG
jgi:hypothetical protein